MQKASKLQIVPIGGLEEVGKNLTLYEFKNEIIIIDCGLKFPDHELLGIDYIINDYSYLLSNKEKLLGIFITHGHLDHIGGLSFLLNQLKIPIYAATFTKAIILKTLLDKGVTENVVINELKANEKVNLGSFTIEPIQVNHSIVSSMSFAISCPAGTVIHSGDFKIDNSPMYEDSIDLHTFARYGKENILALLSDSTNAASTGHSASESELTDNLENLFYTAKGRILISTFSTQIIRIKHILTIAKKLGKRVAICGRSMLENIDLSVSLDIIQNDESMFIPLADINKVPKDNLVIITTGSQGEPEAALTLIARNKSKHVKLDGNDTVIFSSSSIPGNEKKINTLLNLFYKKKVKVVTNDKYEVHATGHAQKDELKFLIKLIRPRFFIPIHGDNHMLYEHSNIAKNSGVGEHNVIIMENGQRVELSQQGYKILDRLKLRPVYVEGNKVNNVNDELIQERAVISENGIIIIILFYNFNKIYKININSKGFIVRSNNSDFMESIKGQILEKYSRIKKDYNFKDNESLKKMFIEIKKSLRTYLIKTTSKSPVLVMEGIDTTGQIKNDTEIL